MTSNSLYWVGLESKMGHEEKTNKQTNQTNKQTLVGGFNPSEKYESQLDDYSQYMEKKKCSKPPIRTIERKLGGLFLYDSQLVATSAIKTRPYCASTLGRHGTGNAGRGPGQNSCRVDSNMH